MGTGRLTDPKNRDEFKLYIRSKLGEPVIQLNVSEFQVDQAVDEALQYYRDYHYNGTSYDYYVYELTQQDIDRRWFEVPDEIIGVYQIYDMSDTSGLGISSDIYSGAWQLNYDIIFNNGGLQQGTLMSFYINKMYYDMVNQILVGKIPLRYNMHENKIHIDSTWVNYRVGSKVVVDCHRILDPDEFPEVWSDRWLLRYATAKLKRQWGENVSKFTVTLPGGVQINGDRIIREADEELVKIEENCLRDYSLPPRDCLA